MARLVQQAQLCSLQQVFHRRFSCFIFLQLADWFCKAQYKDRQFPCLIIFNGSLIEIQQLSYVYKEINILVFFSSVWKSLMFPSAFEKCCDNADISGLSDINTVTVILTKTLKL